MTIVASAVITGCCITAQRMVHYSTSDGKITARRMGKIVPEMLPELTQQ